MSSASPSHATKTSTPRPKACLYSPYIPKHFGGGETFFWSVAKVLSHTHDVCIAVSPSLPKSEYAEVLKKYEQFLHIHLRHVALIASPLADPRASIITKVLWTRSFDVMYAVTDGSFFISLARRNILHIQFPFTHALRWLDRLKLKFWHVKNTNSAFTKKVIEKHWKLNIDVVHTPPIDDRGGWLEAGPFDKDKIILNIGRFFRQLHSKRQDVLVDVFRMAREQEPELLAGWKLICIGNVEDESYLQEVRDKSKGLPIEILTQVPYTTMRSYYQRANIYIHATGFDVDDEAHPERVEHFGITTLEAMAFGCIPCVVNKGGQAEIIHGFPEWGWVTKEEGVEALLALIRQKNLWSHWRVAAVQRSRDYTGDRFANTLMQMVEGRS